MEMRTLGTSGLTVSAIGLGCMGMSQAYGARDDVESVATIHLALDMGITLFDTADTYGPFHNERLLGGALCGVRGDVTIATKFGIERRPDGSSAGVNGRPDYARRACAASLERLGVDHIDLYFLHRVDPRVPIEETVGAMADLVAEGKVRYLGLSEASPETVARAHRVHPIAALQTEFSLLSREPATETVPALRALGIGFVAYSPLSRGLLTSEYQPGGQEDKSEGRAERYPRFYPEHLARNLTLAEPLAELAADLGVTPAQLALAWVLHQGADVIPIVGTKRRTWLRDNVAATGIALSASTLRQLDDLFPAGAAVGDRYPNMESVDR